MKLNDLEKEWHPTKNGELVFSSSLKKVGIYWWVGSCGHEWERDLFSRLKSSNSCPYCSGHRLLSGVNDLATICPALAAEWHPTKNGEMTPNQVIAGGKRKVWWLGGCGHEWDAIIENRVKAGHGCPVCSGKRILVGFNDLNTSHPDLTSEWHPTKNGELTAQSVTQGSSQKIWWQCVQGHEWEAMLSNRTGEGKKRGCPYCAGQKILAGYNDLASADPVLASEWHPTKNGNLTAQQVARTTRKKVWWRGTDCNHEWLAIIANRTIQGDGCPICSGHRVLPGYNDLATTHPMIAAEWHPTKNGNLTPQMVAKATNKNVWWLGGCGHEWKMSLGHRTNDRSSSCTICSGRKVLTGFNDLATTHPIIAAEWHPKKNLNLMPTEVYGGSDKRIWWLGICGHEWQSRINKRTVRGQGCGQCTKHVSKAEEEIKGFLIELGVTVEGSNRTILNGKEIDLWVSDRKLGIEFNGIYWHSEKFAGIDSHHAKWNDANKVGIQLIQIWEDDWNLRPEIIMRTLAHKLEVSKTEPVVNTEVISITEQQAEEFLKNNHLKGFAPGSYYLGVVETGDTENLRAIMVLDAEPNTESKSLEILRYASVVNVTNDFSNLLSYSTHAYSPESITVIADHCEADEELYANNDFIAEKEFPPDYMYVIRTERKPRSEYPVERFRDDPKLLWEWGLTEMELADLNNLNRIWDAGKTRYRLVI